MSIAVFKTVKFWRITKLDKVIVSVLAIFLQNWCHFFFKSTNSYLLHISFNKFININCKY